MSLPGRLFLSALLLTTGFALAACEPGEMIEKMSDLIPTDKKPLPGERKEVFPEGVPGVPQGIPAELMKGYQAPLDTAAMALQATGQALDQPKPEKPKPKKKIAKPKPPSQPAQVQAAPASTTPPAQQAIAWPAPAAQSAPWPAAQTQPAPWPAAQSAPTAAWPAAPPRTQ